MFGNIMKKLNKITDDTEQIDDRFYAEVMDEISKDFKDKAAVGKAIAQSDGNESKLDSIYITIRAKALQEQHRIEKNYKKSLELEHRSNIDAKYSNGYFHKLFKDEIKKNGFLIYPEALRKNGIKYMTKIDYKNMDFLIVNKKDEVLHRIHIESSK